MNVGSRARALIRPLARRHHAPAIPPGSVTERFLAPVAPVTPTTPPGPTIVLLNDCRDQDNYGAEALVDGLIRILAHRLPTATLRPVPSHWVIDAAFGFGAFVDGGVGLHQPAATYPQVADQFETVADDWQAGRGGPGVPELLERFSGADLVLLNGEGSVYRTNLSAIRELYLAWFAKERLGIPTAYVNGGIHLTDVMPVLPAMVRKTFASLDAVAVREPRSLRNLREYVPEVAARCFPDSAFAFSPADALTSSAVAEVRSRIGSAPYFCFDPGPMPLDARPGATSALHRLLTTLQEVCPQAVLVCSAPADAYMEQTAREVGGLYVDTVVGYREFMALVADAQFLVSGRYHNPILAALVGCPTITLASTNHKVHGACEMLDGLIGTPFDSTWLSPDLPRIAEQARAYVDDRAGWRDRLLALCAQRRDEVAGLAELVARVLDAEA